MALADGAGAGAGVLRKIGAGTLQLTATANTYSGTTQVQGGVLDITDDRQLGAAPGADAAQQLLLDGGTLRIGADTVLTATRHPPPAACGLWPVATPISRAEACVWHPPGFCSFASTCSAEHGRQWLCAGHLLRQARAGSTAI